MAASRLPIGAAGAGEIERGAVIHRGAQDRQAERHIDGLVEARVFDHRQALVVVHRQHRIEVGQNARHEGRVGRQRAR